MNSNSKRITVQRLPRFTEAFTEGFILRFLFMQEIREAFGSLQEGSGKHLGASRSSERMTLQRHLQVKTVIGSRQFEVVATIASVEESSMASADGRRFQTAIKTG